MLLVSHINITNLYEAYSLKHWLKKKEKKTKLLNKTDFANRFSEMQWQF